MRRSLPALLLAAGIAAGQDMPLHEIIKPGETWQPAAEMPKQPADRYTTDSMSRTVALDGKALTHNVMEPACWAVGLGGSTLFVADAAHRYVRAFPILQDGTLGKGDKYCRMRVRGDERRWEVTRPDDFAKFYADPTAMTVDAANRIYVATNLGIQVFDPTGRLCGVFTAPPGRISELAFQSDRLFGRVGDKVYVRTMLAEGSK
jgi:sugar lactone lactonase YvrE